MLVNNFISLFLWQSSIFFKITLLLEPSNSPYCFSSKIMHKLVFYDVIEESLYFSK